jgi:hypothetical protein
MMDALSPLLPIHNDRRCLTVTILYLPMNHSLPLDPHACRMHKCVTDVFLLPAACCWDALKAATQLHAWVLLGVQCTILNCIHTVLMLWRIFVYVLIDDHHVNARVQGTNTDSDLEEVRELGRVLVVALPHGCMLQRYHCI